MKKYLTILLILFSLIGFSQTKNINNSGSNLAQSDATTTRGCYYISSSAVTSITASTPIKIAGTTTAGSCLEGFTHTDNRLTYSGTETIWIHAEAYISMTSTVNNVTVSFYVAENGAIIAASEIQRKIGTGADVGAAPVQANIQVSTGDYIEFWVDSDITTDFTAVKITTSFFSIGK